MAVAVAIEALVSSRTVIKSTKSYSHMSWDEGLSGTDSDSEIEASASPAPPLPIARLALACASRGGLGLEKQL